MINTLLNKSVAVLGLGKSGMSAARELKQRGAHVIAWDACEERRKQALKHKITIQDLMSVDFSNIEFLLISPGIPHTYPEPHPVAKLAKQNNVKIISDVELFISTYKDAKYIGITGTNGKSTTTSLIHHILEDNGIKTEIGGNIGVPVFDLPHLGKDGYYVFEMSSYQLELSPSIDFDLAVLLNITPDHLSRHNGMNGYVNVKKSIFDRKTKKDVVNVIALDDSYTKKIFHQIEKEQPKAKNIPISYNHKLDNGYYVSSKGFLIDNTKGEKKEIFNISELKNFYGRHNLQNIISAFVVAKKVGIPTSKIIKSIESFKTLEHRVEEVCEFNGIKFINDSKATNAESAKNALESLNDIYWILGGRAKEGGIDILKSFFSNGKIKRAFTIGESGKEFYKKIKKDIKSYKCKKMENAILKAFKKASKDLKKGKVSNPVILLSPATASFDQYPSFEERGNHFKKIVKELKEKYKNI